jgi:hypothetical protein
MGALAEEAVADLATPLCRVPRTVSLEESAPTLLAKRRIEAAMSSISPYFTKQHSEIILNESLHGKSAVSLCCCIGIQ